MVGVPLAEAPAPPDDDPVAAVAGLAVVALVPAAAVPPGAALVARLTPAAGAAVVAGADPAPGALVAVDASAPAAVDAVVGASWLCATAFFLSLLPPHAPSRATTVMHSRIRRTRTTSPG